MATLHNGILGGFTGRVGNIIGYRCEPGYCIRQRPARSLKPATDKQLAQQMRMAMTGAFVRGLAPLLKPLPRHRKRTASQRLRSQILKEAFIGEYPDLQIHYSAIRVTSGTLYKGCCHTMTEENGNLRFRWSMGAHNCITRGTAVLLAYDPLTKQWIRNLTADDACSGSALLEIPSCFYGVPLETYMFFVSPDRKSVSDSVYTGRVGVAMPCC
ncbi:MAG TPA: DUF6266 family protein [Sphingobacteriaceae bacterium]